MAFQPDRRFDSVTQAFSFLFGEFFAQGPVLQWIEEKSGLTIPRQMPRYLFRGECGNYESTRPSVSRPATLCSLTSRDRKDLLRLMHALRWRFQQSDYLLTDIEARGLLQHYGLPTRLIDFTGNPAHAFTFAAHEHKVVGRICVFPLHYQSRALTTANFTWHDWAERARRQDAFGLATAPEHVDLKSPRARDQLGLRWFEFPITAGDSAFFKPKYDSLFSTENDPSAGFLRHEITEFVEANGKLSSALTRFLLERIPIEPLCYRVRSFGRREVVVNHEPPASVGLANHAEEKHWSFRYWSRDFGDSSWDRMRSWSWPPIGSVFPDPRTFHRDVRGLPQLAT